MKSKLPVITYSATIAFFTLFYLAYINAAWANVAWLSCFDQLFLVEKSFKGALRLSDLVTRYGEHGMIACNVLSILNAAFFGFNTFFDAYINVLRRGCSSSSPIGAVWLEIQDPC